MKEKQVELLAPAGSYDAFLAAIEAGADAVYAGGSRYGARAYAKNFTQEEYLRAIDTAHLLNKKIYMTVNTLMKEEEIKELPDYLLPYYEAGLDAVIVQDIGAISVIRNCFPKLPVHASTQMAITGIEGVRLMQELGIEQVVPARELSLQEIKRITDETDVAIECFIHGAICYSYSGRCLFSSLIGGRSGNRGRCAQPCRLPYDVWKQNQKIKTKGGQYILSMKDMCTIELIPDMIEAGISSFKIEGRMKKPEYVAGVTGMYRKYIDLYERLQDKSDYHVEEKDLNSLLELYTRGGNSKGYYVQKNGRDMLTLQKPSYETGKEQLQEAGEQYLNRMTKIPVEAEAEFEVNQPAKLTLITSRYRITVTGDTVEAAQKRPLLKEEIEKQLNKMGSTCFALQKLRMIAGDSIFMPVKALNELRRNAVEALQNTMLKEYMREAVSLQEEPEIQIQPVYHQPKKTMLTAYAETIEAVRSLCKVAGVGRIYLSYADMKNIEEAAGLVRKSGKEAYLALPIICRHNSDAKKNQLLSCLQSENIQGVLVGNYEWLYFLKENDYSKEITADYELYMMNHKAKEQLKQFGCGHFTMPVELNERELWNLDRNGCELVVYGYLPMMVTAQCINLTTDSCSQTEQKELAICDRYQKKLHVKNCCSECYNVIYNSVPLSLHHELVKIKKMNFESIRLIFTNESEKDILKIARWYADAFADPANLSELPYTEYTKGHFARGVE